MNDWVALSLLVVLLIGNAFFVGAEFAIMSTRRSQIEPLAEAGNKRAKTALFAIEHVSLMLATCQMGITVCSLLILNVSEPALKHLMAGPLEAIGIPYEIVATLSFVVALVIVTYLHVIFGEMIPKNASVSLTDKGIALWFAPPLVFISRLLKPIILLLNWIANHALRALKIEPKDEVSSTFTLDELQSIVKQSTEEGTVEDETGVLSGALEFSSKTVEEIMVEREKVVTLDFPCTPHDIEHACAQTGFSRFVMQDALDGTYMGYVHVKDMLAYVGSRGDENIPWGRLRPMAILRPDVEIDEALAVMQRNQAHLSHVVSAQGVSLGVLFLEDILEQLVGEIKDTTQEHVRRREAANRM